MLLGYQPYVCETLVANFVEVKEKATYYPLERLVGGKNMCNAPAYSCLSRRNTSANCWLCNSAETVSLHVDYNSAVCVWWVCVCVHVHKFQVLLPENSSKRQLKR